MYYCSACKRPAVVTDAGVVRSCQCDSVVIADCSADLQGEGGMKT
jgi:hypothetical protein